MDITIAGFGHPDVFLEAHEADMAVIDAVAKEILGIVFEKLMEKFYEKTEKILKLTTLGQEPLRKNEDFIKEIWFEITDNYWEDERKSNI